MASHLIGQYFLNHELDHDELRRQIALIAQAGYEGLFPHARQGLDTPYDSRAWWAAVDVIEQECRKHNLETWIWDEDYFPSGTGGGRMCWENPALRSRVLQFSIRELDAVKGELLKTDFDEGFLLRAYVVHKGVAQDVTADCGTRRIEWSNRTRRHNAYSPLISRIGPAHWRSSCAVNRYSLYRPSDVTGKVTVVAILAADGRPSHVDLMKPDGIKRYLETIYEPYAARYSRQLGKSIVGAFTDEPSPGSMIYPWSDVLPDEFRRDHGYDLLDNLVHLAFDLDDRSHVVRHHFRKTQGRLMRTNYVEQIARWCRKHNIQFSGHLTRTEWLSLVAAWWPNELRCYKAMDIPCCDPLGAALTMPDAAAYHTGIKVASSAAHLFGKKQAGSDVLAVLGDEASIRDFKAVTDYHMALGVTIFVLHGLSYSFEGGRKDEVPPSLSFQHTQFPHMRAWLDHTSATAEALTQGKHVCKLAVLYPSTSLGVQVKDDGHWPNLPEEKEFHDNVELLLSKQRDFDLIDEITLVEKTDRAGRLKTPQPYEVILISSVQYIEQATADCLNRLAAKGVRIVVVGPMPKAIGPKLAPPAASWARAHVELFSALTPRLIDSLPGVELKGSGSNDVFIHQRSLRNKTYTFLFNRAETDFTGTLDGVDVFVAARSSTMQNHDEPVHHPLAGAAELADISRSWRVAFEPNQAMLATFHLCREAYPTIRPMNLLERQPDPTADSDGPQFYDARFMATGKIDDLTLVLDPATATGNWRILLNDQPLPPMMTRPVFDSANLVVKVGHMLRTGSAPMLNVLTIETEGPGRGVHEPIFMTGSFTSELRHGDSSMPYLTAAPSEFDIDALQPWSAMGRATFSGSATYSRTFTLDESCHALLDLGRVEQSARVTIDGRDAGIAAWRPYVVDLGQLAAGEHTLEVEVRNAPANRDRHSSQTAGLLGPVRLFRKA